MDPYVDIISRGDSQRTDSIPDYDQYAQMDQLTRIKTPPLRDCIQVWLLTARRGWVQRRDGGALQPAGLSSRL